MAMMAITTNNSISVKAPDAPEAIAPFFNVSHFMDFSILRQPAAIRKSSEAMSNDWLLNGEAKRVTPD